MRQYCAKLLDVRIDEILLRTYRIVLTITRSIRAIWYDGYIPARMEIVSQIVCQQIGGNEICGCAQRS